MTRVPWWLRAAVAVVLAALQAAMLPAGGTTGSALAAAPPATAPVVPAATTTPVELPGGGRRVFPGHVVVAYYGTAGTGALGVLGEDTPDRITHRLRKAARPFAGRHREVRIAYELIVTVADGIPGPDGDYSHDISRAAVEEYVEAAHRNDVLLVLDLQPGRSDFLTVAKRWQWALLDPYVGLAIDPEWRMGRHEVPARTIGHVRAREVNRVSAWLSRLTRNAGLPEKLFMVHQFRADMVRGVGRVRPRRGLAMVQHVDGFGTRAQKLATYHAVERHRQFTMGFKLFYDEDRGLMSPRRVLRVRPRVRFVSYQ